MKIRSTELCLYGTDLEVRVTFTYTPGMPGKKGVINIDETMVEIQTPESI